MKKHRYMGFALYHPGTNLITLRTVRYAKHHVRQEAVETERHYLLDEEKHLTDKQLWKRLYGQGYRIIPVEVLHSPQESTND
jgi:hypothetical protein